MHASVVSVCVCVCVCVCVLVVMRKTSNEVLYCWFLFWFVCLFVVVVGFGNEYGFIVLLVLYIFCRPYCFCIVHFGLTLGVNTS